MDILLFLLCIGILIFAEKIFDNHAYNRRSETIYMNLITCLNITLLSKIWRNVLTIIIPGIWRSIVQAIKKQNYLYCNALSNKFQAECNVAKINNNGKYESEIFFLPQLLISRIYPQIRNYLISEKFHYGEYYFILSMWVGEIQIGVEMGGIIYFRNLVQKESIVMRIS